MYCNHCGHNNPEKSKFCQNCGKKISSTTQTLTVEEEPASNSGKLILASSQSAGYPYSISIAKLVTLSIATFSLYEVYWFYKQWKSFNVVNKLKYTNIGNFFRSMFAGLLSYSLFQEVNKAIKQIGLSEGFIQAGWLAFAYFCLLAVERGASSEPTNSLWWLYFVSILPLIPVQIAINKYWKYKYKNKIEPSGLKGWDFLWIGVGVILYILIIYGSTT